MELQSIALIFILIAVIVTIFFIWSYKKKRKINHSKQRFQTIDDVFRDKKSKKNEELNQLLEKIQKRGIENLSSKERQHLDELSKK